MFLSIDTSGYFWHCSFVYSFMGQCAILNGLANCYNSFQYWFLVRISRLEESECVYSCTVYL